MPPKNFKPEKSFSSPFFILKIAQNKEEGPRFGIIVSKKVSKKAVVRNKIKRMLREIIQENLNANCKSDFLFVVKREPKSIDQIQEEILKYL